MSITIQQYAGQLNLANSDMLWEVTSNSSSAAQYQYVCALQDGCGSVLTTIKQQPNPSGKGVFNLGRIVKQYLEGDEYALEVMSGSVGSLFNKNTQTAKFFKVAFGEEYGTSTSSSVTSYTGVGATTGSAAFTGSIPYYYILNGTLDPNYGSFNWDTSSFFKMLTTPSSASFNHSVALTDAPRSQSIQATDYASISVLNGNLTGNGTLAQDIAWVEYNVSTAGVTASYLFDNTNSNNAVITNTGGPRTASYDAFSSTSTVAPCTNPPSGSQTSGSLLLHVGVGPQNLIDNGNVPAITGSWDFYTVKFYPQNATQSNAPNLNGVWDTFTFTRQEASCGYPGVRFGWVNDYGCWDYFNFTLQNSNQVNLEFGTFKSNFVDYSTTSNSVSYNKKRRGTDGYYTNIADNFIATSDWLTQAEADWLTTLFYSPNVFIQEGTEWLPIIILDTQYVVKTNPRTQKNFNYAVSYTLANNKRSR